MALGTTQMVYEGFTRNCFQTLGHARITGVSFRVKRSMKTYNTGNWLGGCAVVEGSLAF